MCPGEPVSTWRGRLARYRLAGKEGLVSRRLIERRERIGAELGAFVDGPIAADSRLKSEQIKQPKLNWEL